VGRPGAGPGLHRAPPRLRLHYTLATGDLTSKHGAGVYALEAFPEWRRLVDECLRIRRGGGTRSRYRTRMGRRRDWPAFVDMVIADAQP